MDKKYLRKKSINTFSIVGYDPATEELGIAVASKFLAVGAVVPYAKAGVGAIATQSWANLDYGPKGLSLLEQGLSPDEVISELTKNDDNAALRQVGVVDASGVSATFTGEDCFDWAGGISGQNFAAQGNILVDEKTVKKMEEVFTNSNGSLAERLLAALEAGENAGGDSRGKQSAALFVVKENGSYGGYNDRYIDVRVDDHPEPVQELTRLYKLHQLYFKETNEEDIVKIEGEIANHLAEMLTQLDYLKNDQPTAEELQEAIRSYHLIENFDERVQPEGLIDKRVIAYMETITKQNV